VDHSCDVLSFTSSSKAGENLERHHSVDLTDLLARQLTDDLAEYERWSDDLTQTLGNQDLSGTDFNSAEIEIHVEDLESINDDDCDDDTASTPV